MSIRFLNNEPALILSDEEHGRILVIGDLHLGIESELFNSGVIIAPQSKKLHDKLLALVKLTNAEKLVLLGDFKHKIPGISFRELMEIPKFMEPLSKNIEIILVKGNHDTELDGLLPDDVKVYGSTGFSIGKYGFFHGHAWPKRDLLKCDHLFTAHIHPTIEFVDSFGFSIVKKVWLRGKLDLKVIKEKYKIKNDKAFEFGDLETIIFPAFNPLITGVPLNNSQKKPMGPLLGSGALKTANLDSFMLDGTVLGKVKNI